jgi:5-methylcytosine-specific restriction endonuclease McrA
MERKRLGRITNCKNCNKGCYRCPSEIDRLFCSSRCYGDWKTEDFRLHPEKIQKLIQLSTGRKQSRETIEKRIAKNKGQKRTPEHIENIKRKLKRGKDNHFWKGGISSFAYRIRRSVRFKTWRESIFTRDNWTCIFCGVRGNEIHPDHIKPLSILLREILKINPNISYDELYSNEKLWDITNGRTLCVICHRRTPSYGRNDFNKK